MVNAFKTLSATRKSKMSCALTDWAICWTASRAVDLSSSGPLASPSTLVEACDNSEDAEDIVRIIHGVVTLRIESLDQKAEVESI